MEINKMTLKPFKEYEALMAALKLSALEGE